MRPSRHGDGFKYAVSVVESPVPNERIRFVGVYVDSHAHLVAPAKALSIPCALCRVSSSSATGLRIRHDAATRAKCNLAGLPSERAYQYVQVHVAAAIEVSKGPGVGAPSTLLELRDDFHAANLRTARNRPAWKHGCDGFARRQSLTSDPPHVGHDVVNVGVGLKHHHFVDLNRAGDAQPPQIVSLPGR